MKTVVDAVNEFHGVWIGGSDTSTLWLLDGRAPMQYGDTITDRTVCTRDEFNQCVAEMTEGLFVPLSDLNKRKASGEAENKTVERKGMIYDVGSLYIGADNQLIRLDRISDGYFIGVDTSGNPYREQWLISVSESSTFPESKLGTITKVPLAIKDGALVMFDCGVSTGNVGKVYTSITHIKMIDFVQSNRFVEADKCTNIVKLVPESK